MPSQSKPTKRRAKKRVARLSRPKPDQRCFNLCATAEIDLSAQKGDDERGNFTINAYNGGQMNVEVFFRPVVIDLAGLSATQRTPVLLDHRIDLIAGQAIKTTIKKSSITLVGRLTGDMDNPDDPAGKIALHARNGFEWQASVGVDIDQLEIVDENQSARVNGRIFKGPIVVVRQGRLGETSFVAVGADDNTSARVAATGAYAMTFTKWLEAKGFTLDDLDDDQKKSLSAMFDAEVAAAAGDGDGEGEGDGDGEGEGDGDAKKGGGKVTTTVSASGDSGVEAMRAKYAAESRRVAGITKVCGGKFSTIEAKAIEEDWTVDRAELEVVRKSRPTAPAVHSPETIPTSSILECAVLRAGGYRGDMSAHFDDETRTRSDKQFPRGVGVQELLGEAARHNGYGGRSVRADNLRDVLHAAFGGPAVQAGFSGIDISGILSNIANKFILEGWLSVEQVWGEIAARRTVSDFKTVTSYRLTMDSQYEKVAPGGEITHGTLGEQSYTNKVDTYALMLGISRTDIINDDLNALTEVPRHLGRGAGLKTNDIFWTEFMANSDFFKSANNNYFDGASSALGVDSLSEAEQKFMDQTDPDGKPIAVMPKILLVPTALKATAEALVKSTELRDTGSKFPTANIHSGKFPPKVSAYLGNTSYTGNSQLAWYLLAEPSDARVIEMAFLNGQESPTIENSALDFNTLGIQMRGYHDIGVSLQEFRGGVKAKGEA